MYPTRDVIQRLRDPAMTGRWVAVFPDTPPGENGINVETINLPFVEVGTQDRIYGGQNFSFPGTASQHPTSMAIYEDHTYFATEWLQKWKNEVFNQDTQAFGLPRGNAYIKGYLRSFTVFLFGVGTGDKPTARVDFEDCYPADTGGRDLSYVNSEGRIVISTTLAVRRVNFTRIAAED